MPPVLRKLWSHHRENAVAIAVIGTLVVAIGAAFIAYLTLHNETSTQARERAEQRATEIRAQAEQVSTGTIAGQSGFPITEHGHQSVTRIGLYNRSNAPVYNAVVTLVLVQGAGPRVAREVQSVILRREFQRDLTTIPPGESEVQVSPGWAGMMARPGIEIAFTDHASRNWIRYANGVLVEIPEPPASYYRLPRPINWTAPAPLAK
jgi:hypothetical protein